MDRFNFYINPVRLQRFSCIFNPSIITKNRLEAAATLQIEKLKTELLQSELNFLRAQINPHLLFNTLSFIKFSTKHSPGDAAKAVMLLSQILDFAIQGRQNQQTSLREEIHQARNLIELNRMRFNNRLYLELRTQTHNDSIAVLPLALLTIVENVLKHGNLQNINQPADIYIESSEEKLIYRSRNEIRLSGPTELRGTGLENISQRLEKVYPGKHLFKYCKTANTFSLELIIYLT